MKKKKKKHTKKDYLHQGISNFFSSLSSSHIRRCYERERRREKETERNCGVICEVSESGVRREKGPLAVLNGAQGAGEHLRKASHLPPLFLTNGFMVRRIRLPRKASRPLALKSHCCRGIVRGYESMCAYRQRSA